MVEVCDSSLLLLTEFRNRVFKIVIDYGSS
jgi:hypothetical protein